MSFATIENQCKDVAAARDRLKTVIAKIEDAQFQVLHAYRGELRSAALELSGRRAQLSNLITAGRELFVKPKTLTFHGIVVGFEKERNKIEYPDDQTLIERIEKMLKAKASTLIQTTKQILKDPFKRLPKAELQMLGVKYINGADKVVIRLETGSDVETEAKAYLSEGEAS